MVYERTASNQFLSNLTKSNKPHKISNLFKSSNIPVYDIGTVIAVFYAV